MIKALVTLKRHNNTVVIDNSYMSDVNIKRPLRLSLFDVYCTVDISLMSMIDISLLIIYRTIIEYIHVS